MLNFCEVANSVQLENLYQENELVSEGRRDRPVHSLS